MGRAPDLVEANKGLIRGLLADVDRGDPDVVDRDYAPGYVDHTPSPPRGLASGREGARQAFALLREAFPDTRHTMNVPVAEPSANASL
jgi:hypothetical protein